MEETFISAYESSIHEVAGALNVLAKIARKDNTSAMGLHLFDKHLK